MNLLSDNELLDSLKQGFTQERKEQVLFLKRLAEVDRRGLWKRTACSLNEFCRKEIGLSESSAWKRIQVCHLGLKIPYALELLENNQITLTNLSILSPCLNVENAEAILKEAAGLGRFAVEAIKARYIPKAEPRDSVTPISVKSIVPLSLDVAPSPTKGLAEEEIKSVPIAEPKETVRVRISYVADDTLIQSMNKVKSFLAHKYPNARLEEIEAEVYQFYLEAHDPQKKETKKKPKKGSPTQKMGLVRHTRYIPVAVKRAVWKRDEGCCSHRYENGTRCRSTYKLQFDHIVLFRDGGRSDSMENLRLLCAVHNQFEADRKIGKATMDRIRHKSLPKGERLGAKNPKLVRLQVPEALPSGRPKSVASKICFRAEEGNKNV